MRALVAAFVGAAAPVGSNTVSHLLSVPLSAASIRNTMAELTELGLIQKPHSSAGRIPTDFGLRLFVDHLLQPQQVGSEQRRRLRHSFEDTDAEGALRLASQLLSESTRQLGFVLLPSLDRVRLRHVTFVRLSSEKLLVVLVTQTGRSYNRIVLDRESGDQLALDRIAHVINERIQGRTLSQLRQLLQEEAAQLRNRAGDLLSRAIVLGQHALELAEEVPEPMDLVVATRLALLDQPEYSDPQRLRHLFAAIEENEKLLALMENLLQAGGVHVALGGELEEPGLPECALVTAPYFGAPSEPPVSPGPEPFQDPRGALGVLGVIGPSRMDYARIIPLVSYCSQLVTEKFNEDESLEESIP